MTEQTVARVILISVVVFIAWTMIGIGYVDPMATEGMFVLFAGLGLIWIAVVSCSLFVLLRRTRDIHASLKRFEEMTEASLHLEKTTPAGLHPRGEFGPEQAGEPRLRSRL